MSLVSWARKELDRFRLLNHKRLLLRPPPPPPTPPVKEVVIAADLHCKKCQLRIADAISKMDGMESMVVHVLEKKVTLTSTSTTSKYE